MLALLLWAVLGWRVGAVELMAELAVCALLLGGGGGGGGRRVRATLRELWPGRPARLQRPA